MGPYGVIFPMIDNAGEAAATMYFCLYPPHGSRWVGPLQAVNYGTRDIDDYIHGSELELCRFIQIETADAVRNLPKIGKDPYIDGYIFGPCDLSGSIGELNNVFGENTQKLIRQAVAILKEAGKCIGISTGSPEPEVTDFWHSIGINMISSGVDYDYIVCGAKANFAHLHSFIEGKVNI